MDQYSCKPCMRASLLERAIDLLQVNIKHLTLLADADSGALVKTLKKLSGNADFNQSEMLSYKMVPKYMRDFEMKSDTNSYRRDENKCIASGQKALLNYHRVLGNSQTFANKKTYTGVVLYLLKRDELLPEEKEKRKVYDITPDAPVVAARAKNRKKETTL